jgi:hypothetical protein
MKVNTKFRVDEKEPWPSPVIAEIRRNLGKSHDANNQKKRKTSLSHEFGR